MQNLKTPLWIAILTAFGCAFSLIFACAMPFAAFAAVGALSLSTRNTFILMGALWAANQAIGFGLLGYPQDASTLAWSGIFALTALACGALAVGVNAAVNMHRFAKPAFILCATFIAYEIALFGASLVMGGVENYTLAIQAPIFAMNLVAFAGLLMLSVAGEILHLKPAKLKSA